ncbi:hypothetical protein EDD11_008675 [Mortierella claussenii]|nr:hypothetical protein EDD11_008675 [Mortierella claussenii]
MDTSVDSSLSTSTVPGNSNRPDISAGAVSPAAPPPTSSMTDRDKLAEVLATNSDVDDALEDDGDLSQRCYPSAVFRPQLDDIMLDQDLLEFYEQLKFLVSLSPLKTAQVLYAFSSATDHLALELEVRRSALDLNKKAFTFYQENTWFTVDLEPASEVSDDEAYESDPKFKILPARHALFPAFQRQKPWSPSPAAYYPYPYYHPYPNPYDHPSPQPTAHPSDETAASSQRRYSKDRDHYNRSRHHGPKSSKRRGSQDFESPVQRLSGNTEEGRLLKRSRQDADTPSLSAKDASSRASVEPSLASPTNESDRPRHRDRDEDGENDRQRKLSRLERRLARKKLKQANKLRLLREAEEQGPTTGERSKEKGSHGDTGGNVSRGRPFKITLVQSGKPLSSMGQSSTGDTVGFDRPKPLHGWIPPADQGDGEGNGQAGSTGHRNIRPSSDGLSGTGHDGVAKIHDQKPGAVNTQSMGGHGSSKKSKNIQATPIQSASSVGAQSPQGGSTGMLYTDKSEDKLKKGTWTTAEEEILLEAVRDLSSENWHAVAMKVPGRNAKQCMQKWQTDLDPQINRLPWTQDEDEKLVEAYHTFGNSWQQIAKMVETRTWYQCYNRVRAKSVKTRILMTASTHPASFLNNGQRNSTNNGDGSGSSKSGPGGGKEGGSKRNLKDSQARASGSSGVVDDQRSKSDASQTPTPGSGGDKSAHDSPMSNTDGNQHPQSSPIAGRQPDLSFSSISKQSPSLKSHDHRPSQPQMHQTQQQQQPAPRSRDQQSSHHHQVKSSSDAVAYWPKQVRH